MSESDKTRVQLIQVERTKDLALDFDLRSRRPDFKKRAHFSFHCGRCYAEYFDMSDCENAYRTAADDYGKSF